MNLLPLRNPAVATLVALAMAASAQALPLTPSDPNPPLIYQESGHAGNVDAGDVNAVLNALAPYNLSSPWSVEEVFKQNTGGAEEKSYAPYYTSVLNDAGGTIDWDGPEKIIGEYIFLVVKDGTPRPYYLFDISGWNGMEQIVLSGFYPNQGAVSHVSIFTSGIPQVPDGGATAALLGLAFMAAGARRLSVRR